jgi:diguanylate cyclase (GGDEF)-like protein
MARILLVDDEKLAQNVYGSQLSRAGHRVTTVGSMGAAREALAGTEPFDVVVTDLILPDGDGMEVLQLAKEHASRPAVIVLTALDKVDPAVRAIKSGAAEYLTKPVSEDALLQAVSRALATHHLLEENAALRRHVALVEAGQRLLGMLDRDKLLQAAAGAFSQLSPAQACLIFLTNGERLVCLATQGLSSAQSEELESQLLEALPRTSGPTFVELGPRPGFARAQAYPLSIDGRNQGFAVLLYERGPTEGSPDVATYLARHLALSLNNVGRFAAVEDMVYVDDLTHLFNARYLELALERQIAHAQSTPAPFSLLFLDLDHFKSVNDTHGHRVGSQLLVEAGKVIKGCTRDMDVVARYGGDEYVVLLKDTDSGGALKVAERIRRAVEHQPFLAREGLSLSLTTCIGVASFPEHAKDKASLLDMADRAMYRGKKSNRNVIYMAAQDLEATPSARHAAQ